MKYDYFPWGVAIGKTFFDREEETKRLLNNLETGKHTLLLAPRRYGKTSLARNVLQKARLPHSEIDLFLALDAKSVEKKILKGIRALIQAVSDSPEQWFNTLREFFKNSQKKWIIGIKGLSLELTPENHEDISENILEGFLALEHILKKKKQRAVIFIDEFQEINKLEESNTIEGAIRHFAQASKHLQFVFSGSNRHMLLNMFNNNKRPLYQLCDRIHLDRIPEQYYSKYLNMVAQETWKQKIHKDILDQIIQTTECHPNIVYILSSFVWQKFPDKQPGIGDIILCWNKYVQELTKEVREELSVLSTAPLRVLIAIAFGITSEITSKETLQKLKLTSGGVIYALKILEAGDYIEKRGPKNYRIINPVVKSVLQTSYTEEF